VKGYQKADIFSFGVIIWEIITRQIPWAGSFEEIEFQIRLFSFFFSFFLLYFYSSLFFS